MIDKNFRGIDDRILAIPVYGNDEDEVREHDHPSIRRELI